ncbi:PadR family transcriptional regulator [Lactobacillus sp. S2-2]|uniref:PadR family transcriptional regulator n=1 Tax=Lactobacillus sp. S2-2 TaxID=2692917 RepID=UPI001F294E1F|nr:PadR family transcriptional regulator [Lactobacillus sp. S2-2]MCF6515325.1 PadR family transcriptional regulator [Lactobacillus sp. S2-2]
MSIHVNSEMLDGMVLALLSKQDYYGYAITQEIQASIKISESTMYPVLRRLKKEESLETYDEPYQGRNRRYYKITDQGKEKLETILDEWNEYKKSIDQILNNQSEGNEE